MNDRLWYPQLDVYDCIRRFSALIFAYPEPPGIERLYIADFYFANPPLLHRSRMSRATRQRFLALRIPQPQTTFLAYPAPALLFSKMEPIQKEALRAMGGKGLISIPELQRGVARLTDVGQITLASKLTEMTGVGERDLVSFLTEDFATASETAPHRLRSNTGLRRPV
ncbi:MAG: hypothetical protein OXG08_00355 [Gammaproteobacteria bacterium]|nr:hypothetical protein [Gammaproteobacteria bacterium]